MRAAEDAPGNTFSVLERCQGLADVVERGAGVLVERPRVYRVRHHRGILHGDVLTDACIAVLFYPLALVQHEKELRAPDDFYGASEKESEEKEA